MVRQAQHEQVRRGAILLALLALLLALPAAAQPRFPPLTGRVVDNAAILSPAEEQALEAKLAALEAQSQRQLVVVTLPDLQGYEISDYGYQLGRHWGLGDKERNDGALLIVAPNERKVRIEVGYGLEGVLTDALSSLIINEAIVPRFRAGDYPGGIAAGVDRLVAQLQLPEEEARRVAEQAQARQLADDAPEFGFGSVLFLLFILFFFVLPMLRAMGGRGRRHRGGSGLGPIILWSALNSISHGGRSGGFGGGGFGGGGFSGGGGSFGGGGASGSW